MKGTSWPIGPTSILFLRNKIMIFLHVNKWQHKAQDLLDEHELKILVVNTKYLGDLIVSTPGLHAIREAHPEAKIAMIVRKGFEEAVSTNPNLNQLIFFDPTIKGSQTFEKLILGIKFIRQIRKEKFNVFIALHPSDRVAIWSWFSGAKLRIGPRKQSFNFTFNRLVDVEEDSTSYLEYYNEIFAAYIGKVGTKKTEFFVPSMQIEWANGFLATNSVSPDDVLIGIHPGASEPTKMWQSNNFIELIKRLNGEKYKKILLIEGNQDQKVCDEIRNKLSYNQTLYFKSDSIIKTAALIKKCRLFITHDTGTRHLAVAVGTPVLALLPEDNLECWNFYEETDFHYTMVGNRHLPEPGSNERAFLDGISVSELLEKVGEILKLSLKTK